MADRTILFKLRLVKRITRLIAAGVLATEIVGRYPLAEIQAAASATGTGKILLTMDDA